MSRKSPSTAASRFGVFELDPSTGELRKKGLRIKLQGQPFKELVLLLDRAGEIVTREELHGHLWPSDTFVDFDRNLNKAIRKLREALGDSAGSPRFVETLPRRGYRFIAPVEMSAPEAAISENALTEPPRRGYLVGFAAVTGLIALVAAALAWFGTSPSPEPTVSQPERRLMLAVLPFDNLSDDPDDLYFGEGLTEEMITTLGKLKPERLGVIARSSVEPFRGRPRSVPRIGSELGVGYLVEGSVRRQENRVRVSAQLVKVDDQSQIWAAVYDRELTDVFSIQSEVAEEIARALSVELLPAERASLAAPTDDAEAYQAYLRGLYAMGSFTGDKMLEAVTLFEEALERDPEFALAQAMRSRAYWSLGQPLLSYPYQEAMELSKSAAVAALAFEDGEAAAHSALGWVEAWYDWDWTAAEASYRRALELNPSATGARLGHAFLLSATMQHDRALGEGDVALGHAPLDFGLRTGVAELYLHARRYEDAVAQVQKVLSIDQDYQRAHLILRWVAEARGRFDEAAAAHEAFMLLGGASPERARELQAAHETGGAEGYWRWHLRSLESGRFKFHRTELASVLGGVGDMDAAFAALEEAFAMRAGDLILLQVAPWFDPLRDDPRLDELVERMAFPPL
jgi:TolB-like protein/DNA-binding winged helix-turn-helix (wHTH) protein